MVVRSVSGADGAGVAAAAQRYILATGRSEASSVRATTSSDGIAVGAAPSSRSQQEQQLAGRTRLHISLVHSPSADTRVEISVRENDSAQPAAARAAAPPPRPQWNTLPRRTSTPAASTAPSSEQRPGPDTPPRMYGLPSWYKQNRELKRRSTAIMQKFIQVQPDGALLDLLADETDAAQAAKDGDDLEDLRNTVTRLSGEVARLQSELNSARLQEFEAQEAAMTASAELDEARRAQEELAELRALRNNMTAAADLLRREVAALRDQCDLERQAARRMQSQADKAVKERNVLAHQSSLLAEALAQDDRLLPLLAEVESLKRLLEEERARVWELQQQDGLHDEHQEELLAERLRIAEEQLSITAARAERSEREGQQLRDRLSELERELEERRTALPPPPAAPPLPPPPPPPPLPNGTPVASSVASPVKLRLRGAGSGSGEVGTGTGATSSENQANNSAVQDMANLLGIPRKPQVPEAIPGGAIDNIINQIKGGRFTLKATEQNLQKEKKEEKPAAVAEMLNILGTLRRRPREPVINSPSPAAAPKDVAL